VQTEPVPSALHSLVIRKGSIAIKCYLRYDFPKNRRPSVHRITDVFHFLIEVFRLIGIHIMTGTKDSLEGKGEETGQNHKNVINKQISKHWDM